MCRRRPFRPFIIELVSGARILVRHPDSVGNHGDLWMFRSPRDHVRLFDASTVAELYDWPEDSPND
jgi:hypothetical protein